MFSVFENIQMSDIGLTVQKTKFSLLSCIFIFLFHSIDSVNINQLLHNFILVCKYLLKGSSLLHVNLQ